MNTNIAKTYTQAALFLKKILLRTGDDAASCKKKTSKEGFNCSLNYKKNKRTKKWWPSSNHYSFWSEMEVGYQLTHFNFTLKTLKGQKVRHLLVNDLRCILHH